MVRDRIGVQAEQNRGRAALHHDGMPGNPQNVEDAFILHLEVREAIWRVAKARDRLVREHKGLHETDIPGCSALRMHWHRTPKDFVSKELFLSQRLRDLTFGVPALSLARGGARR